MPNPARKSTTSVGWTLAHILGALTWADGAVLCLGTWRVGTHSHSAGRVSMAWGVGEQRPGGTVSRYAR